MTPTQRDEKYDNSIKLLEEEDSKILKIELSSLKPKQKHTVLRLKNNQAHQIQAKINNLMKILVNLQLYVERNKGESRTTINQITKQQQKYCPINKRTVTIF